MGSKVKSKEDVLSDILAIMARYGAQVVDPLSEDNCPSSEFLVALYEFVADDRIPVEALDEIRTALHAGGIYLMVFGSPWCEGDEKATEAFYNLFCPPIPEPWENDDTIKS